MFDSTLFTVETLGEYEFASIPCIRNTSEVTFVCLHGLFGGLSNFDLIFPTFTQFGNVLIPKIPHFDNESLISIPKITDWFSSFISTNTHKPLILVGNSMGGQIALDYTLLHSDNVKGLILTGSSGLFEQGFGTTRPRRYDRNYIRRQIKEAFYEFEVTTELVDEIEDVLSSRVRLSRLLRLARSTRSHSMKKHLPLITSPTLLIWGQEDAITPLSVAHEFNALLPHSTLVSIPKCGHVPMMEQPEGFSAACIPFLKSLNI